MSNIIKPKYLRKLRSLLHKRITKGDGPVAHWIWDQPKAWINKIPCRALFMKKEYSASYLVSRFMSEPKMKSPRAPRNFVERPMSHILTPNCGNARCVRPDHQVWMEIRAYKETTVCKGDQHGKTLMTEEKRNRLYAMLDSGEYDKIEKTEIAKMFGVKIDTIYSYRRRWVKEQNKDG